MMQSQLGYYIFVLIAIVVGVIIVKKVTSCLFRIAALVVIVALLAYVYLTYFQ